MPSRPSRPRCVVSAAVVPDAARSAATQRLQDWPAWLDSRSHRRRLPDGVHHRCGAFALQIAAARAAAGSHADVGRHRRLSPVTAPQIVDNAQIARRLGVAGIILFSYDSLADTAHGRRLRLAGGERALQF